MCGRASLSKQEKELEERFNATFYQEDIARYNPLPQFNIAPTHWHPVITNQDPHHFVWQRWGLVPHWAKDDKIGSRMINARMETIAEKPAFRHAYQHRRCLVPFDGFFEWKKGPGTNKQPYLITIDEGRLFSIAGLWETWKSPEGQILPTFTLVTMPPNGFMAGIHDRMPAILLPEVEALWLSDDLPPDELHSLLSPYPADHMHAYPVSTLVNRSGLNDPECIRPIGPAFRPSISEGSKPYDLFNLPSDPS